MLEYSEDSKASSPDTHTPHNRDEDIPYDLICTKYLGTLRTMAYSPSRSASPVPVAEAAAPLLSAESSPARPLNPNVFRPGAPSHVSLSSSHDVSSSTAKPPLARFVINTVGLLRLTALGITIAVLVLQFKALDRSYSRPEARFFVFLAFVQLFWLASALLAEEFHQRRPRRGDSKRREVKIDLGCVTCIFGRPRRESDEEGAGGDEYFLLHEKLGKWSKRGLVVSAIDVVVAWCTFSTAVRARDAGYIWGWNYYGQISTLCFIIFALEIVIAFASQVKILKRAKIQISHADDEDEEDDMGSHKYRIRLPQSPEQRQAIMSLAA
ncbi:hypothetical protein CPLU01_13859 [Colletotrichum plurivorum]|uniref:Uncharacterized protein n=1 Tax=Colletotrichum plurivorum TaxID=2175906 RepID=A0A8H6JNK6_9PEZI|nr:hypothetical protein CPLU01_13859 [Colletotrichum plurivorum]